MPNESRAPAESLNSVSAPAGIRLPASVYVIGAVSMLNDIATDMVTPLIPILLATTMGSGAVALGLVEGFANAVAAFLRLWAGRHSDAHGGERKPLAVGGYLLSNVVRPMLSLATTAWHVVVLRAVDRVGKGLRSAPRDALIVDLAPPSLRARAFGIHSAFDNFGAVCGALIGVAVVMLYTSDLKTIVWISAIPGLLAVALFAFGVREPAKPHVENAPPMRFHWREVKPAMRGYLLTVMLFTFARVAELFVILLAHQLGASTAHALLLWAAFNAVKIFANYGAGVLADRHGRMALVVPGWILHAIAMLSFCFVRDLPSLWAAALFFGFAMSISEGVERAVIGDHARAEERGTLFGWYHALVGVASIPAGLILGGLWQSLGASYAYAFAGACGIAAAALLHFQVAPALKQA